MEVNPFLAFCKVAMGHLTWEQVKTRWESKFKIPIEFKLKEYMDVWNNNGGTAQNIAGIVDGFVNERYTERIQRLEGQLEDLQQQRNQIQRHRTRYMNMEGDIIAVEGEQPIIFPQYTGQATLEINPVYEYTSFTVPVNEHTTGDSPETAPLLTRMTPMGQT